MLRSGDIAGDILSLFFPKVCPVCGGRMEGREVLMCNRCRWDIPLTGFVDRVANPVADRFAGIVPIVNGCAFYFYVDHSGYRDLVHDFKYRGMWRLAYRLGLWFGAELAHSSNYTDIDVVVAVPLHWRRLLGRGYNQSEYLARGIARSMGVGVETRSVVRRIYNRSQTRVSARDRWSNVEGIFAVRRPELLTGRHILLVDDICTTGATAISCAETILKAVPDCRISYAALATPPDSND